MRPDFFPRIGQPVSKDIGHRDDVHPRISIKGVNRSGGTALPAADEANADAVTAGSECMASETEPSQRRRQTAGKFQEITAR